MQGLDNHYSALWVENERRLAAQERTAKFTVRIAVEGFVEIDVEATSPADAEEQAIEIFNESNINIAVTDKSIEDVEQWK
jgi:hypothetical protein